MAGPGDVASLTSRPAHLMPPRVPLPPVPEARVRARNGAPVGGGGAYVLYWMIAARRTRSNHALQRALAHAGELGKPLVVLEALRAGYPWASDRLHAFVVGGMRDNAARLERAGVTYHPYVEPEAGAGAGLLEALSVRACVVVTDEFPAFFLPRMVGAAAARLPVRLEEVDSNGLVPLRAPGRDFAMAFSFRAWLRKHLAEHLAGAPAPDPLARLRLPRLASLPAAVTRRWPRAALSDRALLSRLPIDHAVGPAPFSGGETAARAALRAFVARRLARYEERNHPDAEVTSGLSPYLHFGHLSAHDVLRAVAAREGWTPAALHRDGWGMGPAAEAFLDELVTWRELGFNFCAHHEDHDRYESLPAWARRTLEAHAGDPRPHRYDPRTLEEARTGDRLWNAAQTQLAVEGRLHGYLRMLWGKKLLEWSPSPREALELMLHLNNKYAVDGRDPNSTSGITWVLGRFDRPWPERPIFGTVRAMTSASAMRKLRLKEYLARWAPIP
jgi:deoxyribodipyrimidine photo-lyase